MLLGDEGLGASLVSKEGSGNQNKLKKMLTLHMGKQKNQHKKQFMELLLDNLLGL